MTGTVAWDVGVEVTGTAGTMDGLLVAVASLVRTAPGRDEVLRAAVDLIVERTPIALAWVGEVRGRDEDIEVVAWAGSGWAYLDNLEVSARNDSAGRGPTGTSLRHDATVVSNDIAADPTMGPWRNAALTIGYRSSASFPLRIGTATCESINVYSVQPDFFDPDTVAALEAVAELVSRACERLAPT